MTAAARSRFSEPRAFVANAATLLPAMPPRISPTPIGPKSRFA